MDYEDDGEDEEEEVDDEDDDDYEDGLYDTLLIESKQYLALYFVFDF